VSDYNQYLIGPLMILGPWLLGGLFGWRWGRTWRGLTVALGLGAVLTAAGLAAFLLTAPSTAWEACGEDECVTYLGRWLDVTLARVWPIATALAWSGSAVFFAWLRRSSDGRFRNGAVASWGLGLFGGWVVGVLALTGLVTG
jgi:hypothetical protein